MLSIYWVPIIASLSISLFRISKKLPAAAELAWVKLEALGEVTFLSTHSKDEGVLDYESEFSSYYEEEEESIIWSLTLTNIQQNMAGFYQCEVK